MENSWSNLLPDLSASILARLPIGDRIRFSAVCTSWRSSEYLSRPTTYSPWVMLRSGGDDKDHREFFSLEEWRLYRLHLPQIRGHHCLGSSNGWLFTEDPLSHVVHALNPLTGARARFPKVDDFIYNGVAFFPSLSLAVLRHFYSPSQEEWRSQSSTLSPEPRPPHSLMYARIGDDSWTTLPLEEQAAIFTIHKSRWLYVTTPQTFPLLKVEFRRDGDGDGRLQPKITRFERPRGLPPRTVEYVVKTLTPTQDGDHGLLWLWRHIHPDDGSTAAFTVFRFEETTHHGLQWIEVKSLGDRAIFVDQPKGGVSFSTLRMPPEQLRANSIYFLDWEKFIHIHNSQLVVDIDIDVFNMDERSTYKAPFKIRSDQVNKRVWAPTLLSRQDHVSGSLHI